MNFPANKKSVRYCERSLKVNTLKTEQRKKQRDKR